MSGGNKVPCGCLSGEFCNDSTECQSSFFRKSIPENMCRQQRDGPFDVLQTHLRYSEFISSLVLRSGPCGLPSPSQTGKCQVSGPEGRCSQLRASPGTQGMGLPEVGLYLSWSSLLLTPLPGGRKWPLSFVMSRAWIVCFPLLFMRLW